MVGNRREVTNTERMRRFPLIFAVTQYQQNVHFALVWLVILEIGG